MYLLPSDEADYPNLCKWLKGEFSNFVTKDRNVYEIFLQKSCLEEVNQIANDAILYNSGSPTLVIIEFDDDNYAKFDQNLPDFIQFSKAVIEEFEAHHTQPKAKRFMQAKILHELVHWGEYRTNGVLGDEAGEEFEIAAYGDTVKAFWQSQVDGLAWGAWVSEDFKKEIRAICSKLECDPNHLMAAIAFETGESFSPSIRNHLSGATGLIQFMETTALGLGTSTAELAAMPAAAQLDYVYQYLKPFKKALKTLEDLYVAILWPGAVGKPNNHVLFAEGGAEYAQNKGLDTDKDGTITKGEAAAKVRAKLKRGLQPGFVG